MKKFVVLFLVVLLFVNGFCFASQGFVGAIEEIPSKIKSLMIGKSWKEGCPVSLEDLRYLTFSHWGYDEKVHQGELVVHKDVAVTVVNIFRELFEKGFLIEKMSLIDYYNCDDETSMKDNNSYAFCCRKVRDTGQFSEHSYGMAIDINPLVNPCVIGDKVSPGEGREYIDRTRTDVKGMVVEGDVFCQAFINKNWGWGGNWINLKDYQHFSFNSK